MQIIEINEPGANTNCEQGSNLAVGIDFGTTHSLIAVSMGYCVRVIKDASGNQLIPSIISYANNAINIGDITQIGKPIRSIKRLFGKKKEEILKTPELLSIAGDFLDYDSAQIKLTFGGKPAFIAEIASEIFKYLKQQAERELGAKVRDAVITVPAYFNDVARGEVILAARIAGFKVLRLLAEPSAAAYAFGLNKTNPGSYMVYDLGGGTFDVSIINMQTGVMQVMATSGDNMLGGDDIDNIIADYFTGEYQLAKTSELVILSRNIKEKLTYQEVIDISYAGKELTLDRNTLDKLILPIINRTINIAKNTLSEAGLSISGIVLVGGSTRIPLISKMLQDSFNVLIVSENLSGESVDPDKVVVYGAALQAESLTARDNKSKLLIDAIPLSLGIELYGGIVEKIISKNTPIPISVTKEYTTYVDNQTSMQLHIMQGERELVQDCRSLARFELNNLPPMKAGNIRVEVTFAVDADGILSVSAFEKMSQRYHIVEIKPSYGLSQTEVEEILENAYKNAATDHQNKLLQETIIDTKSLIYHLENAIKEMLEFLSQDETNKIKYEIELVENAILSNDRDLIIKQTNNLKNLSENFASLQINRMINGVLKGKHVDEI
jgi:molecular chaperone HscA